MSVRTALTVTCVLWMVACRTHQTERVKELVFLTRDGCVNTPIMRANLDAALKARAHALDYRVIDVGTLPASDARGDYGTPTVLYDGKTCSAIPEPPEPPLPHAAPT